MLNHKNILELWRASELLTIPELPDDGQKTALYASRRGPLPWENPQVPPPSKNKVRIYTLYLGEISQTQAHAGLVQAFGGQWKDDAASQSGEEDVDCFAAALVVDQSGRVQERGYHVADFVFGYAQKKVSEAQGKTVHDLRSTEDRAFDKRQQQRQDADELTPPLCWADIEQEEKRLRDLAPGLFGAWAERLFVCWQDVDKTKADQAQYPLSKSHFLQDIETLIQSSGGKNLGALASVLSPAQNRIDLLREKKALGDLLKGANMPLERWPANPEHSLMMGQQAAVNAIIELAKSDEGGVRAVNGPPGTGKTTLLRDVIAHVVAKRAVKMALQTSSQDLFEEVKVGTETLVLPITCLGDSGIVVTSNNNSAVENISRELPESGAVHEGFGDVTFLPATGKALLNTGNSKDTENEAWGALAACLGKQQNRDAFAQNWHPELSGEEVAPLQKDLEDTEGKNSFAAAKEWFRTCGGAVGAQQRSIFETSGLAPEDKALAAKEGRRQLQSFLVTKEFEIARSRRFIAALDLHRAALAENYSRLRSTLIICNKMVQGDTKTLKQYPADIQRRLWDLLFLCCPVVSSSLASISRMFNVFQGGQIPWVLIDEAGQATPASGVGALWRAKRAVIVGDPQQVTPVATFDARSVARIAEKLGVTAAWDPGTASIQTLADTAMERGAYIGDPDDPTAVWGGLPLRAHRRCLDPMFKIANTIAYQDQMVQANKGSLDYDFPLGGSCWIDISSLRTPGHVNPEEIDFVAHVRKWITSQDSTSDRSVFFISPFKKVALACGPNKGTVQSGSVHAFQGKEADVVFIVLGSPTGSAGAGARKWAGQTPNILNVALTRAKKRVYIVGSIADWGEVANFDVLAKYMRDNSLVITEQQARDALPLPKDQEVSRPQSGIETPPKPRPQNRDPNWRSIQEIWSEHAQQTGFRVVRKTWKGNCLKNARAQYSLISEVAQDDQTLNVSGSYTMIKEGRESRGAPRPLTDHAEPQWITLEEWQSWAEGANLNG